MFTSLMVRLGFFPTVYAATRNQTHVNSVIQLHLFWGTLFQDALLTELPNPSIINRACKFDQMDPTARKTTAAGSFLPWVQQVVPH